MPSAEPRMPPRARRKSRESSRRPVGLWCPMSIAADAHAARERDHDGAADARRRHDAGHAAGLLPSRVWITTSRLARIIDWTCSQSGGARTPRGSRRESRCPTRTSRPSGWNSQSEPTCARGADDGGERGAHGGAREVAGFATDACTKPSETISRRARPRCGQVRGGHGRSSITPERSRMEYVRGENPGQSGSAASGELECRGHGSGFRSSRARPRDTRTTHRIPLAATGSEGHPSRQAPLEPARELDLAARLNVGRVARRGLGTGARGRPGSRSSPGVVSNPASARERRVRVQSTTARIRRHALVQPCRVARGRIGVERA